jgi:hypothetical protein
MPRPASDAGAAKRRGTRAHATASTKNAVCMSGGAAAAARDGDAVTARTGTRGASAALR